MPQDLAGKCGERALTGIHVLSFTQLYERFRPGQTPPKALGPSRDYNVDMVPKFILSGGELVRSIGCSLRLPSSGTGQSGKCLRAYKQC